MPTLADLYPELYGSPAETLQQNKPGFVTGLKAGLAMYPVGIGRAIEDYGPEFTQDIGYGLRRWGEDVQARNPVVSSFSEFAKDPLTGAASLVGQGLGSTIPALIPYVGGVGRALGAAGSVALGTGISALPSYGGIRATQDQTGEVDLLSAAGGALAVGAIEQLGGAQSLLRPSANAGRVLLGNVTREELGQMARTPLRTFVGRTARVAGEEAGEELLQNPIEQYAGGQDPTAPAQLQDTLFSGFAGGIGGLPFGAVSGGRRAMQQSGLRQQAQQVLGAPGMSIADQLGAAEVAQHFGDNAQLQDLMLQQIARNMAANTPVDLMADYTRLNQIGADNGELFNDVINPYDVGGQVSALQQGQETDIGTSQLGLFGGGGGAAPIDVAQPQQFSDRYAPLPAGEPMMALPHQGQAMPMSVPVEEQVSRAASIMAAVVRGANVLLPDQQWADQVLKENLTPVHYKAFMTQLQEGGRQVQQQKGQPKTQVPAAAPVANEFVDAYKKAGGPYSPVMKQLESAKDKDTALQVVRDALEHKTLAQKVMRALEEVHKQLSGQTMTQYLREKEKADAVQKQGPAALDVRQQAGDGQAVATGNAAQVQAPGQGQAQTQVGATNDNRQVVLPGTAGTKEGAGPGTQVQAQAGTKGQGTGTKADAEQGQTVRFAEPVEAQNFILQKIAEKDPRKAKVLAMHLGWGGEESLQGPQIGERLNISRQRVNQLLKELMKDGGLVESTMAEHGIQLEDLREKDPYETQRPDETLGERPNPNPPSSLNDKRPDAATAGIVDERDTDETDGERDTGFKTRPISELNSDNIVGEAAVDAEGKLTGAIQPTGDSQANERLESFEKAQAEDDVEGQAQMVWDAAVSHYNGLGEKLKTWKEIGKTERGQQTQQDFIEKFKKSVDSAKRDVLQMAAFRRAVKSVYYSNHSRPFGAGALKIPGVQAALKALHKRNLAGVLDVVRGIQRTANMDADGRMRVFDNGQSFMIMMSDRVLDHEDQDFIAHIFRHELSHVLDMWAEPGQPRRDYSQRQDFRQAIDRVLRIYKQGQERNGEFVDDWIQDWYDYLSYPLHDFTEGKMSRSIALSEMWAQLQALWLTDDGRAVIQRDSPALARYLRGVNEDIRQRLENRAQRRADGGRGVQSDSTAAAGPEEPTGSETYDHPAFHGTPHDVHENGGFTTQKIGSGEGAQAYGWGLYFSSNKRVAKWYRERLAPTRVEYVGSELEIPDLTNKLQDFTGDWDRAYQAVEQRLLSAIENPHLNGGKLFVEHNQKQTLERLRRMKESDYRITRGRLYTVELAPKEDEYLDWDKAIIQQSPKVREALARVMLDHDVDVAQGQSAAQLYHELANKFRHEPVWKNGRRHVGGDMEAASKALLKVGIPGIKYLDGSARAGNVMRQIEVLKQEIEADEKLVADLTRYGSAEADIADANYRLRSNKDHLARLESQGNHNYVIFDDKLVKIVSYESRGGRQFGAEDGLPERERFKPQLHEGFARQVDEVAREVAKGEPFRRNAAAKLIPVSRTPVVLRAIQTITGEKPFRKSEGVLGTGATVYLKAVDDHQRASHGFKIPVETLKQLPELLADPLAVFRSGQNSEDPDSYKVVLDTLVDGKPVIVGLKPGHEIRELRGDRANYMATILPIANGWHQVRAWMREGLLRYYDDKRAPAVQPGSNPQGLTGARDQRPDFSLAKSPVKVVTKSELEQTPKEYLSKGGRQFGASREGVETYPEELKPSAGMLRDAVKDTVTNWAKKGLQAVVFAHDLVDIAVKEGLTSAKGFFDLLNAKAAKRTRLEAEIDRVMTAAADLPDRTAVNKFLQTSTRDQRWGYKPSWKQDVEVDPAMEAAYNRLSDAGKKLVDDVFRMGDENYAEIQRLVNKEIDDEYDARLLKAATQDARDQVEAERKKALRTMGRVLPKLQGPYAPLKRFGDYVSVAKSQAYVDAEERGDAGELTDLQQDERHYVVEFHDSFAAAKARARELAPYFAKTDGFEKQKIYRDVQELPWAAIAKVKGAINDMPDGAAHKSALARLVTDLYLTMLSENSARKVELKRRGVHGEDRDMLRAFASQGRASAHFIAALEKNGEIQAQISRMQKEAAEGEGRDNKNRVFNEILARYAQGLDYRPSPLVEKAMTFTSLWMLVTSPAYYLQNSTQPFMLTLPVLSGRYGNGAAWATLTKAYKDVGRFVKQMGHTLDVEKLPLPDDEKLMLKTLRDTGRIDITIAQDLGRWVGGEQFYHRGVFGKVMREVWAMPQRVEMLNRVVSALAAYRLSKGSTEYAGQILDMTHGNYASSNAPRIMNANPAMRLITQFRKFQLIQISLLGRLAYNSFKGATPQERAVARAALGWVLIHHMVAAGALGLPAANIVGYVLAAAFGDDDKPVDFEKMVREAIGDKMIADLVLRGAPTLAGVDVSSRIGMGQAFSVLPFTDIKLTDRDSLAKTLMSAGGPLLGGIAPKLADGMGYIHNGDYLKGFASILPRGLGDALKAYGLATQGLTQRNNDVVLKPSELDMFDVMSQAVGLPSLTLTDRGRRVGQVIETEEYYKDRTGVIKHKYAAAYRDNNTEEMRDLREEWMSVAKAMREQGLKPQPLSNLLKAPREQGKRERQVIEGVGAKKANREFVRRQAGI